MWSNDVAGSLLQGLSAGEYELAVLHKPTGRSQRLRFFVKEPEPLKIVAKHTSLLKKENTSLYVVGGTAPYIVKYDSGDIALLSRGQLETARNVTIVDSHFCETHFSLKHNKITKELFLQDSFPREGIELPPFIAQKIVMLFGYIRTRLVIYFVLRRI